MANPNYLQNIVKKLKSLGVSDSEAIRDIVGDGNWLYLDNLCDLFRYVDEPQRLADRMKFIESAYRPIPFLGTSKKYGYSEYKEGTGEDGNTPLEDVTDQLKSWMPFVDDWNVSPLQGPPDKDHWVMSPEAAWEIVTSPKWMKHRFDDDMESAIENSAGYIDPEANLKSLKDIGSKAFVSDKKIQADPMLYIDEEYPPWVRKKANKLISGED